MTLDDRPTLRFLGGTGTVTGSRFLLETGGARILLDCGLFQGYKQLRLRNRAPFPVPPASIDAVVLTHAHLDHSGYLPALVRDGFAGPIVCSPGTASLLELLLPDSAYLQQEEARFARKRGYSRHEAPTPLYTSEDAERALERVETRRFGETIALPGRAEAHLHHAGHILGAAHVRVTAQGRTVHVSGDLGRTDDPLMIAPEPLAGLPPAHVLLVESTYGDRVHPQTDPADEIAPVLSRVLTRGGVVIIPAFAVGRAQALLLHLSRLRRAGRIPDVPVYLNSPMAVDATALYRERPEEHRVSSAELAELYSFATMVRTVDDSKLLNRRGGPMIIVAASGMLTGGRVLHHLVSYGDDARNAIILTGFQAGGTRGAALAAGAESIRVFGRDVTIAAEVIQVQSMSAHADAEQIVNWMRDSGAERAFIVHGEPEAADALRIRIDRELGIRARVPEQGEEILV
jgi:metallo-beta-lactamase family protein